MVGGSVARPIGRPAESSVARMKSPIESTMMLMMIMTEARSFVRSSIRSLLSFSSESEFGNETLPWSSLLRFFFLLLVEINSPFTTVAVSDGHDSLLPLTEVVGRGKIVVRTYSVQCVSSSRSRLATLLQQHEGDAPEILRYPCPRTCEPSRVFVRP